MSYDDEILSDLISLILSAAQCEDQKKKHSQMHDNHHTIESSLYDFLCRLMHVYFDDVLENYDARDARLIVNKAGFVLLFGFSCTRRPTHDSKLGLYFCALMNPTPLPPVFTPVATCFMLNTHVFYVFFSAFIFQ